MEMVKCPMIHSELSFKECKYYKPPNRIHIEQNKHCANQGWDKYPRHGNPEHCNSEYVANIILNNIQHCNCEQKTKDSQYSNICCAATEYPDNTESFTIIHGYGYSELRGIHILGGCNFNIKNICHCTTKYAGIEIKNNIVCNDKICILKCGDKCIYKRGKNCSNILVNRYKNIEMANKYYESKTFYLYINKPHALDQQDFVYSVSYKNKDIATKYLSDSFIIPKWLAYQIIKKCNIRLISMDRLIDIEKLKSYTSRNMDSNPELYGGINSMIDEVESCKSEINNIYKKLEEDYNKLLERIKHGERQLNIHLEEERIRKLMAEIERSGIRIQEAWDEKYDLWCQGCIPIEVRGGVVEVYRTPEGNVVYNNGGF
jgi:hypothetical protein